MNISKKIKTTCKRKAPSVYFEAAPTQAFAQLPITQEMGNRLDPLHHMEYNEWRQSRFINHFGIDEERKEALSRIYSKTANNMHNCRV